MNQETYDTLDDTYAVFKSKEWFIENAFIDMDNRFWRTETLRNEYDVGEDYELNFEVVDERMCIESEYIGTKIPISLDAYDYIEWGVKALVTLRHNPEYFI